MEVLSLQGDKELPPWNNDVALDQWWTPVFESGKYPSVSVLVKACLSIFTSPMVEQSFSIMNDIITPTTNRLDISTFDSIQTVRYYLSSKNLPSSYSGCNSTALNLMRRIDVQTDPVDSVICRRMQHSYKAYQKCVDKKREGEGKRHL